MSLYYLYEHIRSVIDDFKIRKNTKKYRKEKGYTQFELAEKIGVSEFYISALETGSRKPGRETLIKLSNEMNMPIEKLLELKTDESIKIASDELYAKINTLSKEKQKQIINIMDYIIEELKEN